MKRLALAVFLVLVAACTTYPPPKLDIEEGVYQNYKYGFVISIPEGWKPISKIPKEFKEGMKVTGHGGVDLSHYFKMMFISPDSNGFILIGCEKMKVSYDLLLINSIEVRKGMSQEAEKMKEWALGQGVKTFNYEINDLPSYGGKFCVIEGEMDETNESLMVESTTFIYEVGNKTSIVEVAIMALPKIYDASYECYENVVSSIRYGNSYTKPDED